MHIARSFLETAARQPDAPLLIDADETRYSYAAVHAQARRFAARLAARGVRAGDRVVLAFPSSAAGVCAYLGTLLGGAVAALVDERTHPAHLDFVRRDTGARCWVSLPGHPAAASVSEHFAWSGEPAAEPPPGDAAAQLAAAESGDALILYTSGTTGRPRGVRLTHANLDHTRGSIQQWAQIGAGERELTTLSLSHLFGLAHLHVHWALGGTLVIEPGLRDVPRTLRRLREHRCTSFPGTPSGFRWILDGFAEAFRESAADLRYIIVNSAPLPEPDARRLLELVPWVRCYMYYGLTEASRSAAIHYNANPERLACAGRATPGTELRVGTPEAPLVGEVGEILVRGPHVTRGYWNTDSSEHFSGEWLHTGDLGVLDADGFLTWVGRLKEQINIDGLKVSPLEVEAVLRQHPAVRDCAVVGAPDPRSGQSVVGFVVTDGEADEKLAVELRRHCKPYLEAYKIPRRIQFVASIPRTDTGKVKRLALLEEPPA